MPFFDSQSFLTAEEYSPHLDPHHIAHGEAHNQVEQNYEQNKTLESCFVHHIKVHSLTKEVYLRDFKSEDIYVSRKIC